MSTSLKLVPFILMLLLVVWGYVAGRSGWRNPLKRSYVYALIFAGVALSMVSVLIRPNR
jgi:hypothetical protein